MRFTRHEIVPARHLAAAAGFALAASIAGTVRGQEISTEARCPTQDGQGPLAATFAPEAITDFPADATPPRPTFAGVAFRRDPRGKWVPVRRPGGGGAPPPDVPETYVQDGSETSIAIDVGNSANLVAAYNQAFGNSPALSASANANSTWSIRTFPSGGGTYTVFPYDPWCFSGNAAGELYAELIRSDSGGSPETRCTIARSFNGGASFSLFYSNQSHLSFQDRAMLDIDRSAARGGGAGTAHDGEVYLCTDDYGAGGLSFPSSYLQRISTSGTLTLETLISSPTSYRGSQMQPLAGINDGQCFIMSRAQLNGGSQTVITFHEVTPIQTTLSRSTMTFNTVGRELGDSGRWGLNGHRIDEGIFLDIDRTTGARRGRLYALTNRNPNPSNALLDQGDVYLSYSTNNGSTWMTALVPGLAPGKTQFFPMMAVDDNGYVHIAYYQNEDGVVDANTANIYYTSSTDGGSTWSLPAQVNTATNTLLYFNPPPDLSLDEYYLIGDYAQIKVSGTGAATTAQVLWTTYDRRRSDNGPGNKRERVICTTIPPGASTGACCVGSVCTSNVSSAVCASQGGAWHPGQSCAGVNCNGGTGPANDRCDNAAAITPGAAPFDNTGADTDGPGDCLVNQDVWYRFTAGCGGNVTLALTGTTFMPALAVYQGAACPPTSLLRCNAIGTNFVMFTATPGAVYTLRIGGVAFGAGSGTIVLQAPAAPQVTQQPASASVCAGASALFTVAAGGGTPLSYQWRHNSHDLPGATSTTYSIQSVQPSDVGSYDCRVSNGCGQILSDAAMLTLSGSPPQITQQPIAAASRAPGQSLALSVSASGSGLTYQWRRNGTSLNNNSRISGAATPSLTINPVQASDDGRYDVVVSNSCGDTPSTSCVLCYPNCDASTSAPLLNVSDFLCFQSKFAAGDAQANCDGSTLPPTLNVGDFICFQTRFAAGCP